MYRIYYNDRSIVLQDYSLNIGEADLTLRLDGMESKEKMAGIIESFEANIKTDCLCLRTANLDLSWNTFSSLYVIIDAAGGMVTNDENKFLLIYRNEKWELPKGKVESNENIKDAALREVEEECGISGLEITAYLETSYHTYMHKGQNFLKRTSWFKMHTSDKNKPVPQVNEGITDARWMNRLEVQQALQNSRSSMRLLFARQGIISGNDLY